jgi:hypothetical protein
MSGYIEAGYVVVLGALGCYTASLLSRERNARRRIGGGPSLSRRSGSQTTPAEPASAGDERDGGAAEVRR